MQIEFNQVNWPFISPFRIAYRIQTVAETLQVTLRDGPFIGRGEALGVSYHGETVNSMLGQLASLADEIRRGISRVDLQYLLPPGGARNAVDCALWDLEAKRSGRRAWELAGLRSVTELLTAYTLSVDDPDSMGRAAFAARQYRLLKIKLDGSCDFDRVLAVRAARPDVRLIVDANQSWNEQHLRDLIPKLAALGVELIEQPLPEGEDNVLTDFRSSVPLCADESCQSRTSIRSIVGKYQFVNVKLDKTGGLTEALALAQEAKTQGLKLMVGCMAGSSLSMAPAFTLGQFCTLVDLDGPLLCAGDLPHPIRYEGSRMFPPEAALWG